MTNARPKEGPRAPLFYLLPLLPGWVGFAAAQTVELSDLEVCAALETPELKLACFEAIVATGRRAVTASAETETGPAPDSAVAPAHAGAVAEAEPETVMEVPAEPQPVAAQAAAEQREAVAETPRESVATTPAAESFGSEHLKVQSPDEPTELIATVVDVTTTSRGALVFHLDNGQVWRQIEPRYYPYPRGGEFDVTISTGIMGAYHLQVEGAGRRVTIRRVK